VLSEILNKEIKDLVSAGCKCIQVSTVKTLLKKTS